MCLHRPALFILAAPIRRLLLAALARAAALVVRVVCALHPLWEAAAYAVCAYIIGAHSLNRWVHKAASLKP